ncbi:hypothetical protein KPATCC21470_6261 [Kitasatospora purpeofusca]
MPASFRFHAGNSRGIRKPPAAAGAVRTAPTGPGRPLRANRCRAAVTPGTQQGSSCADDH